MSVGARAHRSRPSVLQAVPGSVAPSEYSGSLLVSILKSYQKTLFTCAGQVRNKISYDLQA